MGTVGAWRRAHDEAVVDLDESPNAAAGGGSQHGPPTTAGTRATPIDVEALGDEGKSRAKMKRRVAVVDLEVDADQECSGDARTTISHLISGNKRRKVPPVICLSPDREERFSNQRNSMVRVSRPSANAAPKEPTFTCPVCLNKIELSSVTSCGHVFCDKCIQAAIKAQKKCPTCRKKLGLKSYRRVYLPATADQV